MPGVLSGNSLCAQREVQIAAAQTSRDSNLS